MNTNMLFLDISSKTGWASLINGQVEVGKEIFAVGRGESAGMRFLRFRQWLYKIIDYTKPQLIGYEKAHYRGGAATELCVGFVTRVHEVAAERGIDYTGVHSCTLKKYITGNGKGSKKDVMEAVVKLYPGIKEAQYDDDIADAIAGLSYLRNQYS